MSILDGGAVPLLSLMMSIPFRLKDCRAGRLCGRFPLVAILDGLLPGYCNTCDIFFIKIITYLYFNEYERRNGLHCMFGPAGDLNHVAGFNGGESALQNQLTGSGNDGPYFSSFLVRMIAHIFACMHLDLFNQSFRFLFCFRVVQYPTGSPSSFIIHRPSQDAIDLLLDSIGVGFTGDKNTIGACGYNNIGYIDHMNGKGELIDQLGIHRVI